MSALQDPAIPKGSIVVVTGSNGLLGSQITDKFLESGYRVRGTVRSVDKSAWMTDFLAKKHGDGKFELFSVPDQLAEGAFTDVLKGASALIHTASPMIQDLSTAADIAPVVDAAVKVLSAAYAEPSIRRVVFTSSSGACIVNKRSRPSVVIDQSTYDEEARAKVYGEGPPGTPAASPGEVYCVSKQMGEKAVWKFYEENKETRPDIVVNTVVPNMNYGAPLAPEHQGYASSTGLVAALFMNKLIPVHHLLDPQQFIDTADNGYLHVAAAINKSASAERIFGMAGSYSWDKMLAIMREQNPGRELPADFSGGEDHNVIACRERGEELLKSVKGAGWASLEETVLRNTESLKGGA